MDTDIIRKLADEALENYDFGDDVSVEAINGWEYNSSSSEVNCVVFLKFDEDDFEDDSHAACFTVNFEDGKVSEASCSWNGNPIGSMPKKS